MYTLSTCCTVQTGCSINHGLLCCWITATTVGGLWGARWAKSVTQPSKWWCNWGAGGGWALSCHGDSLLPTDCTELCAGQQQRKICEDLSKNMGFNVKKLLNDSVNSDAKAKRRKEAMRAERRQVLQIQAADHWFPLLNGSLPTYTKSFWDSMWYPRSRGCILMEYLSSGRFSTGTHCQDHPTVLRRILDSDRLNAMFAGLENAGLLYPAPFLGERSSDTSSQSCHPAFFHCCGMKPASGRMSTRPVAPSLNRWTAKIPTVPISTFQATISFNKRWMPIHWKKKNTF